MDSLSLQNRAKSQIPTIHLEWRNLRVEKRNQVDPLLQTTSKIIINDISGYANPGELTAIMGPSGSGKTTLLTCLCNRQISEYSETVLANNTPYSKFELFGGYVMQDTILMASLTVKGIVIISLRNLTFCCSTQDKSDEITKNARVDQIIKDLYLRNCQDTLEMEARERERPFTIKSISDPNVLILDEPTSGLDSYTAFVCISLLRNLAINQQRTIIFTIHQPNSDIYFLFDKLILLHHGESIYQGSAKIFINHIRELDIGFTNFQNPIELAMRELTSGYKLQSMVAHKTIECSSNGYLKRVHYNSLFKEIKILMHRCILNYIRSPNLLRARVFMTTCMAVFFSILFWNATSQQPPQSPTPVDFTLVFQYLQDLNGICFLCGSSAIMAALNPLLALFPIERKIFLREENNKLYSVIAYFLSKIMIEVPMNISISTILWLYLYWSFGFILEVRPIGYFMIVIFFTSLVGNGLGILTGSLFNDQRRAVSLGGLIMLPLQIFGGLFVNLESLGDYISWFQYLSPFKYSLEAISRTQLEHIQFKVFSRGFTYNLDPMAYYGRTFGLNNCIYVLITMAVSLHILAGISLKLQTTKISV